MKGITLNKIRDIGSNIVTFLAALVPVFKSCPPCPLCMPKYAVVFAFFGLELADYSHYLVPVMLTSMLISLASMFYQIHQKQLRYHTFMCALLSSVLLIASKFIFDSTLGSYIFMGTLAISIVSHYQYVNKHSRTKCCSAEEPC